MLVGCSNAGQPSAASDPKPAPSADATGFDPGCADSANRPTYVVLTCADAGSTASQLTWTSWTGGGATASGVLVENDCKPTCVGGTKQSYPATFRFYAPRSGLFTTVDIAFPGAGPGGERMRTAYI